LDHVERLIAPDQGWELIIVNSASTDGTGEMLSEWSKRTTVTTTIVTLDRPGQGRARNAGAARAAGDLLVYTDDDCYVEPDLLLQINRVFEDPTIGYMGGRVLLFDPTDCPETIKTSDSPEQYPPYSYYDSASLLGANMTVRSHVLLQVGGFDSLLGPGAPLPCADETDMFARASASGWTGVYDPGPTVHHHHGRKQSEIASYRSSYEYAGGAYLLKQVVYGSLKKLYLKHTYWAFRSLICVGRYRTILRYLLGAAKYLSLRTACDIVQLVQMRGSLSERSALQRGATERLNDAGSDRNR
jgi:glycosyltransferase involved in cell wall biosynthesis